MATEFKAVPTALDGNEELTTERINRCGEVLGVKRKDEEMDANYLYRITEAVTEHRKKADRNNVSSFIKEKLERSDFPYPVQEQILIALANKDAIVNYNQFFPVKLLFNVQNAMNNANRWGSDSVRWYEEHGGIAFFSEITFWKKNGKGSTSDANLN